MKTNLLLQHPIITRTKLKTKLSGLVGLYVLLAFANTAFGQTTNVFYEGFETAQALDNWFADGGTWEIGVPTFGPQVNFLGGRSFAGTNCAATVLGGAYPAFADSRLISPSFVVPPAANNPRLRFWQWYEFGTASGQVELRVATSTNWTAISPQYVNTGGDVWTRPAIDLSAYAGRSVQVAFHFVSTCCSGGAGWYVDEVALVAGPLTFNNLEDWEGGLGDWYAEQGTWEVGGPSSGPNKAHSRNNCAATVLGGGYAAFADSRLISPSFVVPLAANNPRLRFWQWYEFGTASGQVELRVATGTNWTAISPQYVNNGGNVWSRPAIDLSNYAGKRIQVAFHFVSTCCSGGAGWYVDEVALVEGPPTFNNPEDWEGGLGDWYAEQGTWEVGEPSSGPNQAHSRSNCAATVLGGGYAAFVDSRLISPSFVVPPRASNPRLRFWQWYEFGTASGQVELRVATGTNWTAISPQYVNNGGNVWSRPAIDLSNYAGKRIQVAFHFVSTCCSGGAGWYIDEVRLTHDFALLLSSTIVRTQEVFCLPIRIFTSDPAADVSVSLEAPADDLANVTLDTGNRFDSTTLIQGVNSEWSINLTTSLTNALNGDEFIGSLCFTAISPHSAFAPLVLKNLVVTNLDNSLPRTVAIGGRAVIIGNDPLLEATLATNSQRIVTVFGKPDTRYEIQHADDLGGVSTWAAGWTNTVPTNLLYSFPIDGTYSNAPVLFLRALEE